MFSDIFSQSFHLIIHPSAELIHIILLTLKMTTIAVTFGGGIGILLGTFPVIFSFPGKKIYLALLHAGMGLPPVVVGLLLYLLLSKNGILGFMSLLYTPTAMIIVQIILITPIVACLTSNLMEQMWTEYREHWYSWKLSSYQQMYQLIFESRYALISILLAGVGRSLSEVGAVMIVGGNIANYTRVMTTSIVLETSKGELVLALSLGIILIILSIFLNLFFLRFKSRHENKVLR